MKIFFGFFNPFFLCVLDKGYNSAEGEREEKLKTVKSAIEMGLSTEQIAKLTSLSEAEILSLQK